MPYLGNGLTKFTTADELTVTGDATAGGTLGVTGVVTANAGVVVDNITIDGTEIDLSSGDFTLDVSNNIILDSGDGDFEFRDTGTTFMNLYEGSNNANFYNPISDADIKFQGNDGGSVITALTLDMSAAGNATFNGSVFSGGNVVVPNGNGIDFSATGDGSGMTSELLDDYEEGDWTPDIRQSGTAVSDAAYNTSFTGGQYTKIGRMVHMTCSIRLTSKGTVTASNGFQIGGLPFTSTNNIKARTAVALYNHVGAGIDMTANTNGTLMGILSHNADEIVFRVEDFSGTTGEGLEYADIGDTLYIQLAFSFITG